MVKVPVIDLLPYRTGADKHGVARAVNTACEDTGFLLISGHGVDEALIANMERVSHAFFDLPVEEKIKVGQPAPDILRGYIGVAGESLARSLGVKAAGDLNESLMIGRPTVPDETYYRSGAAGHHFAVNLWPHAPEDLRDVWTAYYSEMERLAVDIMRVFALALGVTGKLLRRQDRQAYQSHSRALLSAGPGGFCARSKPGRCPYRLRQSHDP